MLAQNGLQSRKTEIKEKNLNRKVFIQVLNYLSELLFNISFLNNNLKKKKLVIKVLSYFSAMNKFFPRGN